MAKSFRDILKKKGKKSLAKQQKDQLDRKDQKGRYPSIFRKSKFPEWLDMYKIHEDKNLLDILPWQAGPDHPTMDEGELVYVIEFFTHSNVGRSKELICCPYETYGKECPVCTFRKSHFFHKDIYSQLLPNRRVAYLVWGHKDKEEEKKGIQIMECSHFLMESYLSELAKNPEGGGSEAFWDEDEGKRLYFTKSGKGRDTKYMGLKFVERPAPIPDKVLNKLIGFSLDSVMRLKTKSSKIEKLLEPTIPDILALNEKLEKKKKQKEERKKKSRSSSSKRDKKSSKSSRKSRKSSSSSSKKKSSKKKNKKADDVKF